VGQPVLGYGLAPPRRRKCAYPKGMAGGSCLAGALCRAPQAGSTGARRSPCDFVRRGDTSVIWGHRLTLLPENVLQARRRQTGAGLFISKLQKDYLYPRTRKEKCQTRGSSRLHEPAAKQNRGFSHAKSCFPHQSNDESKGGRSTFRLTFLTRPVRNVRQWRATQSTIKPSHLRSAAPSVSRKLNGPMLGSL
jgi:hypothetical protein